MEQQSATKTNLLLLLVSIIWGTAFVAQVVGMENVGPFTFNGARFIVGSLSLLPVMLIYRKKKPRAERPDFFNPFLLFGGFAMGTALFIGATLQQVGLLYTTAGNAGFITGLYVIIVPIMGLFWGQKTNAGTWIGAILAVIGMYFLSVKANMSIGKGDLLVLTGAFFWAGHVQLISWFTKRMDSLLLSMYQFAFSAVLSWIGAFGWELISWQGVLAAAIPILYAGIFSTGVAYTLQVIAQKHAHPAHAAIIFSLESVFALLAGWILINEAVTLRGLFGCSLMLTGMLFSQLYVNKRKTAAAQ